MQALNKLMVAIALLTLSVQPLLASQKSFEVEIMPGYCIEQISIGEAQVFSQSSNNDSVGIIKKSVEVDVPRDNMVSISVKILDEGSADFDCPVSSDADKSTAKIIVAGNSQQDTVNLFVSVDMQICGQQSFDWSKNCPKNTFVGR